MKFILPLLPLLALLLLPFHTKAETPQTFQGRGDWGPESMGLRCRLTPEKKEYKIGEPVRLRIEVKNVSKDSITLGVEPLKKIGDQGNTPRQPAEILLTFNQTSQKYFSTNHLAFPKEKGTKIPAVLLESQALYSEFITVHPWGPAYGSIISEAQPGTMIITASLLQFFLPDLDKKSIESLPVIITVKADK